MKNCRFILFRCRVFIGVFLIVSSLSIQAGAEPGKPISVDFQETEMANFLRIIAEVSAMNVIEIEPIDAKVTFQATDRPWGEILDVVLAQQGGYRVSEGNVIKIYKHHADRQNSQPAVPRNYQGRLISLDLQDTALDNALRILEEVSNRSFTGRESLDLEQKVTLRLIDVPWDQVLSIVLERIGASAETHAESTRITSP